MSSRINPFWFDIARRDDVVKRFTYLRSVSPEAGTRQGNPVGREQYQAEYKRDVPIKAHRKAP